MLPTLTPHDFVAKWRKAALKERSAAQSHFNDLCRLVGHPEPAEADPTGANFTFEKSASKQQGGSGFADVWKRGFFAWEYKGKHADLNAAYQQLLQYREALLNPPLLIVSDIERIVVHTNFTNTVKQVLTIELDDLLRVDGLTRLRAIFFDPDYFKAPQTTEQVTQEAAAAFARLSDLLRRWGAPPPQAAHFLIRLLFCLFAEDIGLLPEGLFSRLIERTHKKPSAFAGQLRQLFQAMATGGWFGAEEIPHFNGGLFDDDTVLELDSEGLDALVRVSTLDWSNIEAAIFGTLFERSLDPGKRSQLGAHYTSKEDILLIVEPVLMAPLRLRWAEVQDQARALAERRDAATGGLRTRLQNELSALLRGFAYDLSQVQVLDPACGSGNFLYVALKELLRLEKEVITYADQLGVGRFFPAVSPAQLHGIELNDYAHELASTTIWIGYIQWLHDNGFGHPEQPILKPIQAIIQQDAILAYDESGQPVEPEWPRADVIIGNPPFLGGYRLRQELGNRYVDGLFKLYEGRVPAPADLVCYWFERARTLVETGQTKRVGLLATQAIRGGANRKVLERIKQSGDIFWAQSDRNWILDGAAVHVSMVGFDNGSETFHSLDNAPVSSVNPDLTASLDLTKAARLQENRGITYSGTKKGGPFDLSDDQARHLLEMKGNPNGRPNSDVVKPWVNGEALVGKPDSTWVIDFGLNTELEEVAQYEGPFEYVRRVVYPVRAKNNRARRRELWWLHAEMAKGLRSAVANLSRYVATPRVSKYRIFIWVPANTIPDDGIYIFARDDDYFFGVLHSKAHELWALRTGTQLREKESGNRYTPTTTFETFPFPWPPGQEPVDDPRVQAIAQAARELDQKRNAWLNPPGADEAELKKRTLTNLYNQRPAWLDMAHRKLDKAVLDAYGWPHELSDEEILARLLALNRERALNSSEK